MWQHGQEREWICVFVGLSPIHYPPKTVAVLLIFCSVQFSCSLVSDSLRPLDCSTSGSSVHHQHPELAQTFIKLSQWGHPTVSSSVIPFTSWLQSFPASESFPMSQFFISDDQRIGASVSASVLPKNVQDWFPLGLTGLISLQSKGLSRVFSNTTSEVKHV